MEREEVFFLPFPILMVSDACGLDEMYVFFLVPFLVASDGDRLDELQCDFSVSSILSCPHLYVHWIIDLFL